ncbi:MAG TPA: HDOD domain-containing protein [Thiobacillaceae bacterium]|nr:HDOD domain-containing protein [Thiobacillaceae bacterium]HNU65290.1 HDOD domain-containing protein [Thiobacillaceae bacterium]
MHNAADQARIEAILASGIKIPPLPEVLVRFQRLLAQPDVDIADMARLIRQDGALSGAVFRVVGSPVFGLRAKAETVEKAVTLLGIPPTLSILRGIALRNALGDGASCAALETLWQRSNHIAGLVMTVTRLLRPRGVSPDQAYTLGMFHDCGLALLAKRFPTYGRALLQPPWPDIPALDQAHATDHALLGSSLARNWQLPDLIVQAIRQHHAPAHTTQPEAVMRLNALLNLACHLARRDTGEDDGAWTNGWRTACLEHLHLDASRLDELEAEVTATSSGTEPG